MKRPQAFPRQEDPGQLVAPHHQAAGSPEKDSGVGSVVRTRLKHLIPMPIGELPHTVDGRGIPGVDHGMKVLGIFIVQVPIGSHLAHLRVGLVHHIPGLVEEESLVVPDGELDVGRSFLGESGRESVAGQGDGRHLDHQGPADLRCAVRLVQIDSNRSLQKVLAPLGQRQRNPVLIRSGAH